MTADPDRNRERAEEEAAVWLLRLSEAPDDPDLRAGFEDWRGASDLHAEIWARTRRAYDLLGKAPARQQEQWRTPPAAGETAERSPAGRPPAENALRTAARPARRPTRISPRQVGVGVAASALVVWLAITFLPDLLLRVQADLVTTTAELRSADLADGSRVWLAPESAIEFDFVDGERRVHLIEGEAFFEVESNPSSPFRVVAGDTVTSVLGTAFEVRRIGAEQRVTVQHGGVQVEVAGHPAGAALQLVAGDWLHVGPERDPERGRNAPEEVAAWRNGELIARDRPMGEIVQELRRYYDGVIVIRSQAFAARRVSGVYSLRSPARTLRDLAAAHGAALEQVSTWLMVVVDR